MWNEKHFSSFLKGFHLSKIVSDLRVNLYGNLSELINFCSLRTHEKTKGFLIILGGNRS